MPIRQEWGQIAPQLEQQAREALDRILVDASDKLIGEIQDASRLLMLAARRNRPSLVAEARDILLLAVEEQEIAARKEFEGVVNSAIDMAFGMLFQGLSIGLKGLTVL